uniref:Heterogeneous nuclear ribonucleoprotein H n=1 Tax=Cacopsylla melanoneura TaxID=428564 RepID=A0A8D8TK63_9HEMI
MFLIRSSLQQIRHFQNLAASKIHHGDITKRFNRCFSCCNISNSHSALFFSRPPVISVHNSCKKFNLERYESTNVINNKGKGTEPEVTEEHKVSTNTDSSSTTAQNMGKLFQDSEDDGLVVKLRGLPWSTTVDEILKFFDGIKVRNGRAGVQITTSRNGRPSGEAFVELEDEDDMENALRKDKEHLGSRYIEVFKVKRSEMDWLLQHTGIVEGNAFDHGCVRLRGLPFESKKEDILQFFEGLEIIPSGITLVEDPYNGKCTGEAYVQFVDKETAEQALQKHKEKIGHRYIEIFKSTLEEIRASTHGGGNSNDYVDKMRPMGGGFGRPGPYDRNDRFGGPNRFGGGPMRPRGGFRGGFNEDRWNEPPSGGFGSRGGGAGGGRWVSESSRPGDNSHHTVHMRGLPFRADEKEIADFFRPVIPVHVDIHYENGRPSGEADVDFETHADAVEAMSKDRKNMQNRYIELFLNSSSPRGGGGGGFGNGGRFGGGGDGPVFDRRQGRGGGSSRGYFDY